MIARVAELINWWLIKRRRSNRIIDPNLVRNFSVERGIIAPNNWNYSLIGTEWVTTDAHDGTKSVRLNPVSATADWRTDAYPVVGNTLYRCGLWIKGAGNIVTVLAVRWFSDAVGTVYIGETWIVLDQNYAAWREVDEHITAPANALSGDLMFRAAFATTIDVLGDAFFVEPDTFAHGLEFDSMHNSGYLGWL